MKKIGWCFYLDSEFHNLIFCSDTPWKVGSYHNCLESFCNRHMPSSSLLLLCHLRKGTLLFPGRRLWASVELKQGKTCPQASNNTSQSWKLWNTKIFKKKYSLLSLILPKYVQPYPLLLSPNLACWYFSKILIPNQMERTMLKDKCIIPVFFLPRFRWVLIRDLLKNRPTGSF